MDPIYLAEYGFLPSGGNFNELKYSAHGSSQYFEFPSLTEYIFPRGGILI